MSDDKKYCLSELIKAFEIFLRYGDIKWPTHCEHDEMTVCVDPHIVSDADKRTLDYYGFNPELENDSFKSTRYGSA